MSVRLPLLLAALVVPAACHSPPPSPWLRYEASNPSGWQSQGDGRWSATLLGAVFAIDLHRKETRVELVVENTTAVDLQVQLGPEATQNPTAAIGELQRRPLDRSRGEDVPDYVPYVSMQPTEIRAGWRAVFDLDSPLGREPTIGQYMVLVLEVRDAQGHFERRLLPLVATNAGTLGNAPR